MTYDQTISYLFESLPMYQRIGHTAYKADLENAWELDRYFGHPHRKFKSLHVAGTNGKGSVSHMLAAVLQAEGYRVGLYTSPHLLDFRERVKINGEMISREFVCDFVEANRKKFEEVQPSFFEMSVFMAFCYFVSEKVDVAIIEVGLGGRLDTTNIIHPLISVITNIGLDHTRFLGDTLPEIAREKAGILKESVPAIIGRTDDRVREVFETKALQLHCPIHFADQEYRAEYSLQNTDASVCWHYLKREKNQKIEVTTDLAGFYQKENLGTVLTILDLLRKQDMPIAESSVDQGLKNVVKTTGLSGRWQVVAVNPLQICDIAHNEDGLQAVLQQLNNTAYKRLHLVLGFVNDKNLESIVRILPSDGAYYLCEPSIPRAMKMADLEPVFQRAGYSYRAFPNVGEAHQEALKLADPEDLIYIGGSTFIVADFLLSKKNQKIF
ncbi:MAG: bifunctional folylpolyglutamate synthase/dihydrofolate synthase [Bacteroidales bacterium]|nr:bifunctional folylpolyglutamate synthase/dihydrofolate synthase [Bacteroidales bacterium]